MRHLLSAAALAALLTGGSVAAVAATVTGAPTTYVQMNSPGDGVSSNAARTGNGRMRRSHKRHRGHHHHGRHHHHR